MSPNIQKRVLKGFLLKFWGSTQNHLQPGRFFGPKRFQSEHVTSLPRIFRISLIQIFLFFIILSTVCKKDAWSHGAFHRFFTGSRQTQKAQTFVLASRSDTERLQRSQKRELRLVSLLLFPGRFQQQRCFSDCTSSTKTLIYWCTSGLCVSFITSKYRSLFWSIVEASGSCCSHAHVAPSLPGLGLSFGWEASTLFAGLSHLPPIKAQRYSDKSSIISKQIGSYTSHVVFGPRRGHDDIVQ